jgi:hypothetical protein
LRVDGYGFRVKGLGFLGLWFTGYVLEFRVWGKGFRVKG